MEQLTYYVAKNGVRMHIYKDCLTLKKSKVLTEVNYEALKNNKLDICKKCMKRYDKFDVGDEIKRLLDADMIELIEVEQEREDENK